MRGGAVVKILGTDVNFEIENKKKAGAYLAVMAICIGFTAVNLAGKASRALSPSDTSKTQTQAQTTVKQNSAAPVDDDKSQNIKIGNSVLSLDNLLAVNPFVEMNLVSPLENSERAKQESPRVSFNSGGSGEHHVSYGPTGNIPLPNISSAGKPLDMSIQPTLGGSGNGSNTGSGDRSSVKGIMSDEYGNAMAIMSDGKIIQSGDTYKGNTVSEVNDGGVIFDDGSTLSYK